MSHCSTITQVPGDTALGTEPKSSQHVTARRAAFLVPLQFVLRTLSGK